LVSLDADEYRRLQAAARADQSSTSDWVRRHVLVALARHEKHTGRAR
jgi:hypothetical protein